MQFFCRHGCRLRVRFSGAERTADAGGSSRIAEPGGAFPGGGATIPDAIGGTGRARNDSGGMGDGGA
ncbi:MAG: hypothetical protein WCK55_12100 [Verrucomicrobiota bacterium]